MWFSGSIYYLVHQWYQSPSVQQIDKPTKPKTPDKKPVYNPNKVLEEVRSNGYYQNPKLTLKKLAARMELNINDLSQTINAGLGKSSNDFINELRVEEVKRKLPEMPRPVSYPM